MYDDADTVCSTDDSKEFSIIDNMIVVLVVVLVIGVWRGQCGLVVMIQYYSMQYG